MDSAMRRESCAPAVHFSSILGPLPSRPLADNPPQEFFMFPRACRLVAAACLVAPLALGAQSFEYAASTGQYRVSQKTSGTQDAAGQTQEFQTTNNELLTVTVARPTHDTLALT